MICQMTYRVNLDQDDFNTVKYHFFIPAGIRYTNGFNCQQMPVDQDKGWRGLYSVAELICSEI